MSDFVKKRSIVEQIVVNVSIREMWFSLKKKTTIYRDIATSKQDSCQMIKRMDIFELPLFENLSAVPDKPRAIHASVSSKNRFKLILKPLCPFSLHSFHVKCTKVELWVWWKKTLWTDSDCDNAEKISSPTQMRMCNLKIRLFSLM